jgi:hypothetical protein
MTWKLQKWDQSYLKAIDHCVTHCLQLLFWTLSIITFYIHHQENRIWKKIYCYTHGLTAVLLIEYSRLCFIPSSSEERNRTNFWKNGFNKLTWQIKPKNNSFQQSMCEHISGPLKQDTRMVTTQPQCSVLNVLSLTMNAQYLVTYINKDVIKHGYHFGHCQSDDFFNMMFWKLDLFLSSQA